MNELIYLQPMPLVLTKTDLLIGFMLLLMELVVTTVLLPSQSTFFYILTSGLLIFAGVSIWLQLKQKSVFLLLLFVGVLFFWATKTAILATEFWSDEIGVIQLSQKKFDSIAKLAMTQHLTTPPLDYQNLHWWLVLTQNIPASQQEFFWRMPYMAMHTVTAIFFAFIVLSNLELTRGERKIFVFFIFLLYLTNPLFFVYGFEIRFYALSLLGLLLIYYGYLKDQVVSVWWICIALLFSLNSAVFPIFIAVFASVAISIQSERPKKGAFWLTLIVTQILILFAFSKTLSFPSTVILFHWERFSHSLNQFIRSSFLLPALLPLIISAWIRQRKQLLKEIPPSTYVMLISSLAFIVVIFLCFTLKPHFNIGVRHFMLGIPALFIFFYQSLIAAYKKWALVIFFILLLVQLMTLNQGFKHHLLVGKNFMNMKHAFEIATPNNNSVIFLLPTEMYRDFKEYYETTLEWYGKRYHGSYYLLTLDTETCQQKLLDHSEAVFIKGESFEIPCTPKKPIQILEYPER